jgi:hypothetical protein
MSYTDITLNKIAQRSLFWWHEAKRKIFVFGCVYFVLLAQSEVGLVHPFWMVTILVFVEILRGDEEVLTRLICAASVFLGVIPITGWLQRPDFLDPVVLLIAIWISSIVYEVRQSKFRISPFSITPLTAIAGGVFTYQWWTGLSKGSPGVVLEKLLPIWDLSTHFHFFISNLLTQTYIAVDKPPGNGLSWSDDAYPTGAHYVWGQFAAGLRNEIAQDTTRAIPIFANSIVVTLAISVVIIGLCIGRIGTTWPRQIAFATLGTGLGVGVMTLGPMSQTIWNGFANMPAVIIGLAILASILVRPCGSYRLQILMLTAGVWIVVYNWYPAVLLVIPAIIHGLLQITKKNGWRDVIVGGVIFLGGGSLPILHSLKLGVSHLEMQGGIQPFPPGLLIAATLGVFAVALMGTRLRTPASLVLLGLPPIILLMALGLRLRLITDGYPYYFQKAALFIATFSLILLMMFVLLRLDIEKDDFRLSRVPVIRNALGSLAVAICLTYMFGYWGPDYQAFSGGNTAAGVLYRNEIMGGIGNDMTPTARLVVAEARASRDLSIEELSCLTLMIPDRLGVEPKFTILFGYTAPKRNLLANVWFHALTRSNTTAAQSQAYMTPVLAQSLGDERLLAETISKSFDPGSVCVFSSSLVNAELKLLGPQWRTKNLQE